MMLKTTAAVEGVETLARTQLIEPFIKKKGYLLKYPYLLAVAKDFLFVLETTDAFPI